MTRKKDNPPDYEVVPISELDHFRIFLGPIGERYDDHELRRLYDELHVLAELLLDIYLWKRKKGKS